MIASNLYETTSSAESDVTSKVTELKVQILKQNHINTSNKYSNTWNQSARIHPQD